MVPSGSFDRGKEVTLKGRHPLKGFISLIVNENVCSVHGSAAAGVFWLCGFLCFLRRCADGHQTLWPTNQQWPGVTVKGRKFNVWWSRGKPPFPVAAAVLCWTDRKSFPKQRILQSQVVQSVAARSKYRKCFLPKSCACKMMMKLKHCYNIYALIKTQSASHEEHNMSFYQSKRFHF